MTNQMGKPRMEMTWVGTLTLTQIWLTTMILAMMPMDLTPVIQVILLPVVMIQTLEVEAGLENTTVLVLNSMVLVVAVVPI